jgi:hypothetical protein
MKKWNLSVLDLGSWGVDALRALPRVLAKGPLKPYRGSIHKTKAPPTAL